MAQFCAILRRQCVFLKDACLGKEREFLRLGKHKKTIGKKPKLVVICMKVTGKGQKEKI